MQKTTKCGRWGAYRLMMGRVPSLARWLCIWLVGCSSGESAKSRPGIGCYQLTWNLDTSVSPHLVPNALWLRGDSVSVGVQGVLRQRVDLVPLADTIQSAGGNQPPWHERFYNRWWQMLSDDSIRIELMDDGHMLWEFWFEDVRDSLVGRARLRSHVRGLLTQASVVAHPRECVVKQ